MRLDLTDSITCWASVAQGIGCWMYCTQADLRMRLGPGRSHPNQRIDHRSETAQVVHSCSERAVVEQDT